MEYWSVGGLEEQKAGIVEDWNDGILGKKKTEYRRQKTEDRRMKQIMMECWNVGILLKKVIPLILFILSIEISVQSQGQPFS